MTGSLLIISAPSGAGKTSLVNELTGTLADIVVSISHTTRAPRQGERDRVDYHFTDERTFERMVEQDAFLEHARVFDRRYGTSRDWVEQQRAAGRDVVLEIDWQGARQVRSRVPDALGVFVLPPSLDELRARLRSRGQDDPQTIERRMNDAVREMSHYDEYDYLVVNDDFHRALADLQAIVRAMRQRTPVQRRRLGERLAGLLSAAGAS